MKVCVIGFGTVGKGVCRILLNIGESRAGSFREKPELGAVLVRHSYPDSEFSEYFTEDFEAVLKDTSIGAVVECVNGIDEAFELSRRALNAKKHVVSSNKAVIAKHGAELLSLAEKNGVKYLFEASCGGGIPVVRVIRKALRGVKILKIRGILNGTSNYILSRMENAALSFDEALSEAKKLGYAEHDPSADIDGDDAMRKIAILLSVAEGISFDFKKGLKEGIRDIDEFSIRLALELGFRIRLIAEGFINGKGKVELRTCPMLIPESDSISHTFDAENAVKIESEFLGEIILKGQGAGEGPTASAIVADLIECADDPFSENSSEKWKEAGEDLVLDKAELPLKAMIIAEYKEEAEKDKRLYDSKLLEKLGISELKTFSSGEKANIVTFEIGKNKKLVEKDINELKTSLRSLKIRQILRFFN